MLIEVKFRALLAGFLQRSFAFGYPVQNPLLCRFPGAFKTPFPFALEA
jgi:hypothetical protein